jgi:hypothetical protein
MSYYHSLKTCEDVARRFLNDLKGRPGLKNQGEGMIGAELRFDSEVNIAAYRIGQEGFVLAECGKWPSLMDFRNPARFLYHVRCSEDTDRFAIIPIDLNGWPRIAAKAKKITEVKIDLSSPNKEFIERIIRLLFAKVRDEIVLRGRLRLVDINADGN